MALAEYRVLYILTSKQMLCAMFARLNHLYLSQTEKIRESARNIVFFQYSFMFLPSFFFFFGGKLFSNAEKDDFHQQSGCQVPAC